MGAAGPGEIATPENFLTALDACQSSQPGLLPWGDEFGRSQRRHALTTTQVVFLPTPAGNWHENTPAQARTNSLELGPGGEVRKAWTIRLGMVTALGGRSHTGESGHQSPDLAGGDGPPSAGLVHTPEPAAVARAVAGRERPEHPRSLRNVASGIAKDRAVLASLLRALGQSRSARFSTKCFHPPLFPPRWRIVFREREGEGYRPLYWDETTISDMTPPGNPLYFTRLNWARAVRPRGRPTGGSRPHTAGLEVAPQ